MLEPLDQIIAKEEREHLTGAVRFAVSRLPETERLVTRLAYFENMDEQDIGSCLAMPAAKVRRALMRAQQMLRARLA